MKLRNARIVEGCPADYNEHAPKEHGAQGRVSGPGT